VLILVIVLPIVLTKKNDPDNPYVPVPEHYNPYSTDPKDVKNTQSEFGGVIHSSAELSSEKHS